MTRFIGREREVRRIADLVARERLVTWTGAGGIGNTRLAVQVAEATESAWADGAWFVDWHRSPTRRWFRRASRPPVLLQPSGGALTDRL